MRWGGPEEWGRSQLGPEDSEMMTSERQSRGQTTDGSNQAWSTAASRLAQIAGDQFWAARRAGDRPAMIHWWTRESVLRRHAHGVTALIPSPAHARAAA